MLRPPDAESSESDPRGLANGIWVLAGTHVNPAGPGQAVAANSGSVARTEGSGYVSTCAVEGMETNSRRMFLAISILFCAIISAFWMSW